MVSLPFSSPLIQTAAVTVASPRFQTCAMIVASPLVQTAVLVVTSPELQTCAMIPSYQSIQTSVLSLPSLWTQAETETNQHNNSSISSQPDKLPIQPPQQNIPSININEISFEHSDNGNIKVLGKGATAEVLQGNLHNDCWVKKIAIKLFTNDQHKNFSYIVQEARILQILNNSNVTPKVYGIIQNNSFPLCLVEELIENSMELYKLLSNPSITHSAWLHIALNISKSLKVIHDAGVLVNDIKSDNIMINTHDLSIKFIDMGHASQKGGRSFDLPEADAYKYPHMGPEISCGQTTTKATDIFSLGYLLRMFPTSPLKVQGQLCMHPCPAHRPLIDEVVEYISSHIK
ncbi:membrane-associated tyrosine- and threonine-specific cdc2-inhibitory kinase-like [Mytilus trossulus]|uniref:membrane-associated tyrosine- and threonine-specific cdc2-inhibitory kinase-like n=1 Tax=Mytilus trossulus TaxID=6551 RepID=UPI0030049EB6